jgi:ribosomal protein L28
MISRTKKTKRVFKRGLGIIDPRIWYTKEGIRNAVGLSTKAIRQMVASGLVKPRLKAGRNFYRGREIIRWIDSEDAA